MTDKRRKSFSLDEPNAELCDDHDNASALVNDLLTQYRKGADKETVAIDLQIQQKKRELEEKDRQRERVESELQELRQLKAGVESRESADLQRAKDVLSSTPRDPSNVAIQDWADDLGMTPEELIEELE